MARDFNGSTQYLTNANAVVSGTPLTLACWFRSDDVANAYTLMCVEKPGPANPEFFRITLRGNLAGDPVTARAQVGVTAGVAQTTSGFSASTWHHACAVFTDATNRAVFLDGGNKGTESTNAAPSGLTTTSIGTDFVTGSAGRHMAGLIAEAGVWNVALSDTEVAILALGVSPLLVRPQSLVAYWPLIGRTSPEIDLVGGYGMTLTNAPTVAVHPRVLYQAQSVIAPLAAYSPVSSYQPRHGAVMLSGTAIV